MNDFSYELMKEVALASDNGEFSLSPVSVAIYLVMLANATAGDAHTQILQTLGAEDINTLNSMCEKFMHHLPYDNNGSSVSINNRFWVADSYTIPAEISAIMACLITPRSNLLTFPKKRPCRQLTNGSQTIPKVLYHISLKGIGKTMFRFRWLTPIQSTLKGSGSRNSIQKIQKMRYSYLLTESGM